MNVVARFAACACALALLGAAPADPLGTLAATLMSGTHTPGMVVLVVDRGRVTASRAFGVKNLASGAPVDLHTRFEIGSITKQFTAAAILQLAEHGKLGLGDTLGTYFPDYAAGKNVTLVQMLAQVSGLPSYTDTPEFGALIITQNGTRTLRERGDAARVLAMVRDRPLPFTPGTRWAYSNTNYYLLGRIVEIVSGTSWNDYVRTQLFAPAGMTESGFMEDEPAMANFATGYAPAGKDLIPTASFNGWAGGAGAIVSTAADVARWDAALLGGRIVTRDDLAAMLTAGPLPAGAPDARYGFGWMIDTYAGQAREWHNGGTLGFSATNQIYPDLGETIVVLANNGAASADAVANAVFGAMHPALVQAAMRPAPGEDAAVTARAKRVLAGFIAGNPDRAEFTAAFNAALTPEVMDGATDAFGSLGTPTTWTYAGSRGKGPTVYTYHVAFTSGIIATVTMVVTADGKISGFWLRP